jgi:hypothetical protein
VAGVPDGQSPRGAACGQHPQQAAVAGAQLKGGGGSEGLQCKQ